MTEEHSPPTADSTAGPESEGAATDLSSEGIDRTGPLSDLAATVGNRNRDADDSGADPAAPGFEELFDREDVAEIDGDRLWSRLEADDGDEADGDDPDDRTIREIEKGSYCHRCEHFAEPPTVACTREGTEILELASIDTFRVADCPVAAEDERLERR